MGKYRPFMLFGVAIIIAFIVTILVIKWLQKRVEVREAVPLETLDIAIAKIDLKWGTAITNEMIEIKPFLKKSLPGGYFQDTASLAGRVLVFPVKSKEPIFESRLAPISVKTGGVAAMVSPKKRAIAVKVDKVIGVSGFIHPGNRVDVLVTLASASGKTSTPITKTVLENILVLTTGPEIETKGKEEKPFPAEVITLEVSPEEAEKLALAAAEGRLQLALRNFTDTEDILTKGTTIPALLSSYSSYSPRKEIKAPPFKIAISKNPIQNKTPMPAIEKKWKVKNPFQKKTRFYRRIY